MKSILITGANIVNEGKITRMDILVKDGLIYNMGKDLEEFEADLK
jgi:dihydroorotase